MNAHNHLPFSLCVLSLASLMAACATTSPKLASMSYPDARRGELVETLHGVEVADPYRWMEESSDEPELRAWIEAENALTETHLSKSPHRERIRERLTELWDYPRYATPSKYGEHYFWTYNSGLQAQGVYMTGKDPAQEGRVLLDPNTFSEDGTVALSGTWPSRDGKRVVYSTSDGGSDWKTFRVVDTETGKVLPDELRWVKFSGATWDAQGEGFWYSRYPVSGKEKDLQAVNYHQKLYYHRLGTDQAEDVLVHERPDKKEWAFSASLTDDGRYLLIYNWVGTERKNRLYYIDLERKEAGVQDLLTDFDAQYSVIGSKGSTLYVVTDHSAPRSRLIAIDIERPQSEHWREVIPESRETLRGVSLLATDRLIASSLKDAHTAVRVYDLEGKALSEVKLPSLGSARGFGGKQSHTETFYSFTSFTTPGTIYRYDVTTGKSTVLRPAGTSMNADDYEVSQVFIPSIDGTKIPVFLTHRKGIKLDGSNPTFLYGYGGFKISLTPYYSTVNRVWLEMGGVLAIANLRGGGEYGAAWHDAGRLANKQNVFDDFASAARWLVSEGYTQPSKLAIGGGSNGGLLVGASICQNPELFGAALPAVGVLDMLRFHKFTIGWAWTSDYGSPDDPEMFKVLRAYSPLHNLKEGTSYPATLITTGDHDDRVVPAHSFKFAAELQRAQAGDAPVMIRIETRAGHGAGKPTKMRIDEATDKWSFVMQALGMALPAGF